LFLLRFKLTVRLDCIRRGFNNSQFSNMLDYIWDISMKLYHLLMMAPALEWWSRFYGLTHENIDFNYSAISSVLFEKRLVSYKEFHVTDIFLQFPKGIIETIISLLLCEKLSLHYSKNSWGNVLLSIVIKFLDLMLRFKKIVIIL
jgi:hypothetical protein